MAHPDNITRALRDERMFVERWQCKFGWHRWTKWSKKSRITKSYSVQQERECVDCGKICIQDIED